jgi:hypothetical protein
LHSRDIINIAYDNKFLFSDCKIVEVFKTMDLGEHRNKCNINKKQETLGADAYNKINVDIEQKHRDKLKATLDQMNIKNSKRNI